MTISPPANARGPSLAPCLRDQQRADMRIAERGSLRLLCAGDPPASVVEPAVRAPSCSLYRTQDVGTTVLRGRVSPFAGSKNRVERVTGRYYAAEAS